jgi:hypothetical protein
VEKKTQEFSAADAGVMFFSSMKERMELKSDPLYSLEHHKEVEIVI